MYSSAHSIGDHSRPPACSIHANNKHSTSFKNREPPAPEWSSSFAQLRCNCDSSNPCPCSIYVDSKHSISITQRRHCNGNSNKPCPCSTNVNVHSKHKASATEHAGPGHDSSAAVTAQQPPVQAACQQMRSGVDTKAVSCDISLQLGAVERLTSRPVPRPTHRTRGSSPPCRFACQPPHDGSLSQP